MGGKAFERAGRAGHMHAGSDKDLHVAMGTPVGNVLGLAWLGGDDADADCGRGGISPGGESRLRAVGGSSAVEQGGWERVIGW